MNKLEYLLEIVKLLRVLYDKISNSGGGGTYNGASPTNVSVGALPANSNIAGLPISTIIERMTNTYLVPTFSSFNISAQATLIEVGTILSGLKNFTWSTTNSSNIQPDSILIRDVTSNVVIASGLTNDGSETIDIGVISNVSPTVIQWRGEGVDTNSNVFTSALFTVTSIYPYFWGKTNVAPIINQSLIDSGNKVISSANGTITINFNASNEYLWFAVPATSPTKTSWFVNALNQGLIGSSSDLFNSNTLLSVNSPSNLWSGVLYEVYISNYPTTISLPMEIRN